MFQTWIVPVLLLCLLAIVVYAYVAARRHTSLPEERRKPKAIRRGKHINE